MFRSRHDEQDERAPTRCVGAGEPIDGVLLIDTRAPIVANMPGDADDATLLSWFARDLAVPFGKTLTVEPSSLRALPDDAMFDHVLDRARAMGVLPDDADAEQLARYFEVYLANGIALRAYAPPPETLPLVLLRAADEPRAYGPLLGWNELAGGTLDVHDIPGDHNSVMRAPNAEAAAGCIDRCFALRALPDAAA